MSCTARQGHLLGAAGITAANQGKLTQEQRVAAATAADEAELSDQGSLEVSSGGDTDGEISGSDGSLFGGDSSSDEEGMEALLQSDLAENGLPAEARQGRKPLPQVTALERLLHKRGGDVSTSYDELQAEPPKAQGGRTATWHAPFRGISLAAAAPLDVCAGLLPDTPLPAAAAHASSGAAPPPAVHCVQASGSGVTPGQRRTLLQGRVMPWSQSTGTCAAC